MTTPRAFARKIPLLHSAWRSLRNRHEQFRLRRQSTEDIFSDIFRTNAWRGAESISGTGSDLQQTEVIARELPGLVERFGISTMLDIPCGDFRWMQEVDLGRVDYIGADIVDALVEENQSTHARDNRAFRRLNLIEDQLPRVDLVFCRDCLVHFSCADIRLALQNICKSGATYLLTTTFTARERNGDIATGQWHAVNLMVAPFCLPQPLQLIDENCTEGDGSCGDKALGLWRVTDIETCLECAARKSAEV